MAGSSLCSVELIFAFISAWLPWDSQTTWYFVWLALKASMIS